MPGCDVVRCALLAGVLLQLGCAHAAGTLVARATELRAARYVDAPALRRVEAGSSVDVLGMEAGWVNVRIGDATGWMRASGLAGDGATVAALARLETGRSASGNIVVAAGIRRIQKASRHALIIGISGIAQVAAVPTAWPGVAHDVAAARAIARAIGVPDDNVDVVENKSAVDIERALDALVDRVQPGDQVLIYFSGPGTTMAEAASARCAAAWVAADGRALPATILVERLHAAFGVAGKVLLVSDAAYAVGADVPADSRRKMANRSDAPQCQDATPVPSTMPLVQAAVAAGAPSANVVHLQSAAGEAQGLDDPLAGGLFTQALVDCMQGDAVDLDASGSITVDELAGCMERRPRTAGGRQQAGHLADASGNTRYVPIASLPAAPSQSTGSAPSAAAGTNEPTTSRSPAAALADVLAQRDERIKVELQAEPSGLVIGKDFLDLRVHSSHAGFVYLILLGSDQQSFYLLFPNDLDRDNRIAVGETLRLPRPQWRVLSQGPAGRDVVLAVVSESERDVRSVAGRKAGPFSEVLTDLEGRVQLQWLLGRSAEADAQRCLDIGRRRNLQVAKVCSDAYGAARVDVIER